MATDLLHFGEAVGTQAQVGLGPILVGQGEFSSGRAMSKSPAKASAATESLALVEDGDGVQRRATKGALGFVF